MTLTELIAGVEAHRKTLTVFNADGPEVTAIRDHFTDRNVNDGADTNKCALLAEEREPGAFYGFWTYGPDTVDRIIDHIVTNYTITDHTSASG